MLPVENQESCECLSRRFYSPRKRSFCRAVRNEHDISGPQHGIRGLPRQDIAKVYGCLRSCSVLFIGADNACAALGGRARQAFTQSDHLQHRDFLIRFHCETATYTIPARETLTMSPGYTAGLWRGSVESRRSFKFTWTTSLEFAPTLSEPVSVALGPPNSCNRITGEDSANPLAFAKKNSGAFF